MISRNCIVAAFLSVACCALAPAQEATDARALFERSMAHVSALDALSFEASITAKVTAQNGPSESKLNVEGLFQGEKQGRIRSYTADDEAIIYSDGAEGYVHLVKKNEYVKMNAVPDSRKVLVSMTGAGPIRLAVTWLGEYLTNFPDLTSKLESAELMPSEAGTETDRLKLAYENFDVTLELSRGEKPEPRGFSVDFAKSIAKQQGAIQGIQIDVALTNWNGAPEIAADAFGWRPPEGMAAYAPPQQQGADAPELGKAAPEFKLATLEGGEVSLSDHKDKDIVVLDFFASWCGPCRTAMPVVHELAESYEEKGVKLYAVNIRETPEKVNQFLQSAKLEGMSVLMDRSGKVGMDYGAMSIPRMVVIGKDGTVQAIHSGFSPDLRQRLADNLDTLLSGKKLVEGAKAS
jgi:thiol-disulfide isomerase/thioredoxin